MSEKYLKYLKYQEKVFGVLDQLHQRGGTKSGPAPQPKKKPFNHQTIVIIRHAEKPDQDLGQLTCTGLNRSLLLPNYFRRHFPAPDYIFAPNPSLKPNKDHYYVRPLATIEPTAISFGLPINAGIGAYQHQELASELLGEKYHNSVIFVSWEHLEINKVAEIICQRFGVDTSKIPFWHNDNYGMYYVFTIDWNRSDEATDGTKDRSTLTFQVKFQNFIGTNCPVINNRLVMD